MKRIDFKSWKTIPFCMIALMPVHMILCIISLWNWTVVFRVDSFFMLAAYIIPVLIVFGLTAGAMFFKNDFLATLFAWLKMWFVLMTEFFTFGLMLLAYHNPSDSQTIFIIISCFIMALLGIAVFIFETYKIDKAKKQESAAKTG